MLNISYGLAVILLLVYIASRLYLHNPFGKETAFEHATSTDEAKMKQQKLLEEDPEINQWVGIMVLLVAVAIMAVTAEWVSWMFEGCCKLLTQSTV
jgi:Ca2+:H+ antiporter